MALRLLRSSESVRYHRALLTVSRSIFLAAFNAFLLYGAISTNLPSTAHVRLLTPLSSVSSTPGMRFRAEVIAPVKRSDRILMPQGTLISGIVVSRKAVGLGLKTERAQLALDFRDYTLPDGSRYTLQARLKRIENGRETVLPDGQIRGILAADSPQEMLGGIWTRPTFSLFQRSVVGLTGAAGHLWQSYSLGPIGAAGLFALRCAMFQMPEPNIQLPIGAELTITVLAVPEDAPNFVLPADSELPVEMEEFLRSQPLQLKKANGRPVKDIINLAFEGSAEELLGAFNAAGWKLAQALNAKSVAAEYSAFTGKTGYAEAPASLLTYLDREPDFVLQKSLSDIALRHHVRIWRVAYQGRQLWLGAATQDIGLGFDPRGAKFTHQIDPRIDGERSKISNDLTFFGCSSAPGYVPRQNLDPGSLGVDTDGRLAVLELHSCTSAADSDESGRSAPVGTVLSRTARRVVLETRQYVERENTFFWTYRVIKWSRTARNPRATEAED